MRIGYADPPYPDAGRPERLYRHHPDYGGPVDHAELLERLQTYDGWVLHTSSTALASVLPLCPAGVRVGAWVKPFAAFKPGITVAYAWEPVLFWPARVSRARDVLTTRDWVSEPITLRRGLAGAKPAAVCRWAFLVVGAQPGDQLDDLYPGTGAVGHAWEAWQRQTALPI
jgi:hypothetical protein